MGFSGDCFWRTLGTTFSNNKIQFIVTLNFFLYGLDNFIHLGCWYFDFVWTKIAWVFHDGHFVQLSLIPHVHVLPHPSSKNVDDKILFVHYIIYWTIPLRMRHTRGEAYGIISFRWYYKQQFKLRRTRQPSKSVLVWSDGECYRVGTIRKFILRQ